ncbi:MAG: transketolase [Myxococcaceae bacterium]
MPSKSLDQLCIDTIRTLSMDAVQQASSGHPGTPMALAPVGYQLWQNHLRFDPDDPSWPNRDRFVLSVGHASMLLYSLLHLTGVKEGGKPAVSLDDIKKFRQLESRAPGHPEYRWTPGVETTTGPLGQGVANSVGMALASRWLGAHYNRPGFTLFDHDVYALCGDGDLMEGVAAEAASLAGHLKLSNLCWIYDSNHITIEGSTSLAFSEDVGLRFQGLGWHVLKVEDANDRDALEEALKSFKGTQDKPTLIIVTSQIGYGAPKKQGTREAHGEPLGEAEVVGAKKQYGWPEDAKFLVPDGVREHFDASFGKRGRGSRAAWLKTFSTYKREFPALAHELELMERHELPAGWDKDLPTFAADSEKGIASRESSSKVLNAVAQKVPWLLSGSADLWPSTKTRLTFEGAGDRNLHYGVREHAMASVMNGLALSKLRPLGSTFLIFSDYAKPAIRLSAIMELPVLHVFTHDSIGVGEDGPTHQPIEQLASLRAIPGLIVLRPADANEVAEAWKVILPLKEKPVALALSRQNLPTFDRSKVAPASGLAKGAYVLADSADPQVLLIATGSEVQLALAAHEKLVAEGIRSRVVSMPSWELFESQSPEYRASVLPPQIKARVTIEQAATFGWERYAGTTGTMLGMSNFGLSAPLKDLLKKFGFTADNVVSAAKEQVKKAKG